jgi:RNA polymerase sigma-70 factor (ECF subfamily)
MNEPDFIRAAQSGDLEAFNQLVLAYQDNIFNTALWMLGDNDFAADLTQDAFIAAFRNITNFRGGFFGGWLTRIVINKCYDELRRQKQHPSLPLETQTSDGEEIDSPPWLADPALTPEQKVEAYELTLALAIEDALNALATDFRAVLVLADIQGLNYMEVAATLRVPVGTVKSRLARARLRMREHLRGVADDHLDGVADSLSHVCPVMSESSFW